MKKLIIILSILLVLCGCGTQSGKDMAGYGAGRNFTSRDSEGW